MPATRRGGPDNENVDTGARRYSTRIKVIVNSHQTPEAIEFGDDVVQFNCSKTIKGTGKATLVVTPSRNFLNVIFPNDYINIYINRSDADGWTRVFFGFIDRVSETFKISEKGVPVSNYKISCSDFAKAFDRTDIYFNPSIMGRDDFKSSFGAANVGGLSLITRGITAAGSPPDVILQVLFALFGFGGQFTLPDGIEPNGRDTLREARVGHLKHVTGVDLGDTIAEMDSALSVEKKFQLGLASALVTNASDDDIKLLAKTSGITETNLDSSSPEARRKLMELFADEWLIDSLFGGDEDKLRQINGGLATARQEAATLLDLVDLFTFVERESMDGYMAGTSIWMKGGSLASFLQSYSNELVNELFWDLRAVNQGDELELNTDEDFERSADAFNGNFAGDDYTGSQQWGVKYVPALVYREYPFSTIGTFDASKAHVGLKQEDVLGDLGVLQFGNIFNDVPNTPGRHTIEVPNINLADLAVDQRDAATGDLPSGFKKQNKVTKKHIDVAVVSDQEIVSMDIGRSDADHFNLFAITSDAVLGTAVQFITSDYLPLICPIDIERNGLRVRSVETRFDRFTPPTSPNGASVPSSFYDSSLDEEILLDAPVGEGTPQLPIAAGSITSISEYGYRTESNKATWQFHYGIDMFAAEGTQIVAPVDATVVGSAPEGAFGGFGITVVLKHKKDSNYSIYTHMSSRAPKLEALNYKPGRANSTGKDFPGKAGQMSQIDVKAGDPIGSVGTTLDPGKTFENSPPHCHMEVFTKYPASDQKLDETTPRAATRPTTPVTPSSTDPVRWLDTVGAGAIGATNDTADQSSEDGGSVQNVPAKPEVPVTAEDTVKAAANVTGPPAPTVDSRAIRYQLLRWVLLQDHWYQHNKEYLSGTITMRGAPDIRVGYRLDLLDRALSFYVESVTHSWKYPGQLMTTLAVTRGQPNRPFPAYVIPAYKELNATDSQRKQGSRLGTFFLTPDPQTVRKSTVIRGGQVVGTKSPADVGLIPDVLSSFGISDNVGIDGAAAEFLFDETLQFAGESVTTALETNEALINIEESDEETESSTPSIAGFEIDPEVF